MKHTLLTAMFMFTALLSVEQTKTKAEVMISDYASSNSEITDIFQMEGYINLYGTNNKVEITFFY